MAKCPNCDQPMASVLRRKGGVVRMYYECLTCSESPQDKAPPENTSEERREDDDRSGSAK